MMGPSTSVLFSLTLFLSLRVFASPLTTPLGHSMLRYNYTIPILNGRAHCFSRDRQLFTPVQEHCIKAIDLLLADPHVMSSKRWIATDRNHPAGEWNYETCQITIGLSDQGSKERPPPAEDNFSAFSVVGQAQAIIQECVADGPGSGGSGLVGPRRVLRLYVGHWNR